MRDKTMRAYDPAVALAAALLLVVLGWRIALVSLAASPLRPDTLFATASPAPANSSRLVLVIDAADTAKSGETVQRVRGSQPRLPLDVHRVPWPAGDDRSRPARIAALVRAYGHAELPVLLTLTPEGQVVRVQSLVEVRE